MTEQRVLTRQEKIDLVRRVQEEERRKQAAIQPAAQAPPAQPATPQISTPTAQPPISQTPTPQPAQEAVSTLSSIAGAAQSVIPESEGRKRTLYENADLATGPIASAARGINATFGLIPGIPNIPDYDWGYNVYNTASKRLRQLFQAPGTRGNRELQEVEKAIDIEPSIFKDPERLREALDAADFSLRGLLAERLRILKDPGLSIDEAQRRKAQEEIVGIESMLDLIGAPGWENIKSRRNLQRGEPGTSMLAPQERTEDQIQEDIARAREEGAPELRAPLLTQGLASAIEVALGTAGGVAGAGGGGALGAIAGPAGVAGGGALGGALLGAAGSAAGRGIGNLMLQLESTLRYGDPVKINAANQALSMLDAATTDLAYSSVFAAPTRVLDLGAKALGRFSGAQSPDVLDAINDALRNNISFGASEIPSTFSRGASRVLNVIPVIGTPARRAGEAKAIQVSRAYTDLMDELSPSIDLNKLGVRIPTVAKSAHRARKTLAGIEFEDMREAIRSIDYPELVPTDKVSRVAREYLVMGETPRTLRTDVAETVQTGRTTRKPPGRDVAVEGETAAATTRPGRARKTAATSTRKTAKGVTTTRKQKAVETTQEGRVRVPGFSEPVNNLLEDLANMSPRASFTEMETLQRKLNQTIAGGDNLTSSELGMLRRLQGSIWESLSGLDEAAVAAGFKANHPRMKVSPEDATQIFGTIMHKVRTAKRSWADLKALEDTVAAGFLKSVDKNFFSAGFQKLGPIEADRLAEKLVNSPDIARSPQFIRDLRRLVGQENTNKLARSYLEKVIKPTSGLSEAAPGPGGSLMPERMMFPEEGAVPGRTPIVAFNAGSTRDALGLSANNPQAKNALEELLLGTGVTTERLDSFLRAAERVENVPLSDPSTFVQRRLVLTMGGGGQSVGRAIAGAATGGIAHTGGILSIGGMYIGARAFARLMTSPAGLRILRDGLKPNATRQELYRTIARITRQFPDIIANQMGEDFEGPRMGSTTAFGGPR